MRVLKYRKLVLASSLVVFAVSSAIGQTLYVPGGSVGSSGSGSIDPDSYSGKVVAGAIADGSGWGVSSAIGGNAATGHSWGIGSNGMNLYFSYGNGSANDSLSTFLVVAPNRNIGLVPNSGSVGIGTATPGAKLHIAGSNQELRLDYNGTNNYYGSLRWAGLQFGNNGANRIVAGRTAAGGLLDFYVNNTNEGADYGQTPNGILAMRINSNGQVGIGSSSPGQKLEVAGIGRFTGAGSFSIGSDGNFTRVQFDSTGSDFRFLTSSNQYGGVKARSASVGFTYGDFAAPTSGMIVEGSVGIGTTNPGTNKLAVNGKIRAQEIIVEASPWPDDVFEDGYDLKTLGDVEAFIGAEGHLPDVPNAATIAERGVHVGEMQAVLLRKIEELTLHQIALEKRTARLEEENSALRTELTDLKQR